MCLTWEYQFKKGWCDMDMAGNDVGMKAGVKMKCQ